MAFVLKKVANPGDPISAGRSLVPQAPGAVRSLQIPGQVPDRSSLPEHGELPVALPTAPVRPPLTEYGSAQRIMGVYEPRDGSNTDVARFEQATVSYEELRKADPALRTPARPTLGYALADGTRIANSNLAALSASADTDFVEA
jgi:hypothetical protein